MTHTRRLALLVALTVTMTIGAVGAAQAAISIPYLPWTTLLPPVPIAYTPSTSPYCPQGQLTCVDETIGEMTSRLDELSHSCRHEAVFQLMYLRVSQQLRTALTTGVFQDNAWTVHEMASFAATYFNTFDAWQAGNRSDVP
ncbi:MAG: hypothetical protein JHC87_10260, partial [Thermoleophilaceae bacterium]|nr:hypothetical protein [Thermoleophilaceae bacterium]